ncbi:MAG TPA: hypothetical protein PLQ88_06695, partial [Blastocatellia bacterium]|nr:hypothetical protein [Blastocatellia bacterium]
MPAIFPSSEPFKKQIVRVRHLIACLLVCSVVAQGALADSITYRQLRQDQGGRTATVASAPKVVRTDDPQDQNNSQQGQQAGVAQESPTPPEFVRLPDGRIVRYGPGIV